MIKSSINISPFIALLTVFGLLLSIVHYHAEHGVSHELEFVEIDHEHPCVVCISVKYSSGEKLFVFKPELSTPYYDADAGINPDLLLFISISERAPPFRS